MLLISVCFAYKRWELLQWVGLEKMPGPRHETLLTGSTVLKFLTAKEVGVRI